MCGAGITLEELQELKGIIEGLVGKLMHLQAGAEGAPVVDDTNV
jgi:hypothetical protein